MKLRASKSPVRSSSLIWCVHTRAASAVLASAAMMLAVVAAPSAQAQTYRVLYAFTGESDGEFPFGGLVRDAAGNLYSTTDGARSDDHGTVFKLSPAGKLTTLHTFTGGRDGSQLMAGLIRDAAGDLYGTTVRGGDLGCESGYSCGLVFRLNPTTHKETVLHAFTAGADGANPEAGLVRDAAGNLYGTTYEAGTYGRGTVFKLSPTGKLTTLHTFTGGPDGASPQADLILDAAGNLYGTTPSGGTHRHGVVFKLDTTGHETVLYSFTGGADGAGPVGRLVRDEMATSTARPSPAAISTVTSWVAEWCSSWIQPATRRCCIPSLVERTGHIPKL